MATYRLFDRDIGSTNYAVWVTDGLLQFVVGGEIREDVDSIEDFLALAARQINQPNGTDDDVVEARGAISDRAAENYEGGSGPALDTNGTSPSIGLRDEGTEVVIGGAGVGGSFRADFGSGDGARAEAGEFAAFARDLLGTAATTVQEQVSTQIGDFQRTVTISTRDDDVRQIQFKSTGETGDLSWADVYIADLAGDLGGEQVRNGNVNDLGYDANQLRIQGEDGTVVDLGPSGVGGKEQYQFETAAEAQEFFAAVKAAFGPGGDRREVINDAIEVIADDLGGTQLRDGNVSTGYTAGQIGLRGADRDIVDLGNQGVGGKEQYQFADQRTAQTFIDRVRDAVGVEPVDGRLVDEFVYKVSGGAGISGSPTFVGKDDFVAFIGEEYDGTMIRNGSISESYSGGARIIGDGSDVKLGPSGVGGTEVWDFQSADDAVAFVGTLHDIFA